MDRILSLAPNATSGSTSGALDYKVLLDLGQGTLSVPHAGAVSKEMLLSQRIYRLAHQRVTWWKRWSPSVTSGALLTDKEM